MGRKRTIGFRKRGLIDMVFIGRDLCKPRAENNMKKPKEPQEKIEHNDYFEVLDHPFKVRVYKDISHRKEKPNIDDFYYLDNGTKFICITPGIWTEVVTKKGTKND